MADLVGVIAAFLTTSCWIPQLFRTLRRGTASDFSWSYLATYGTGLAVWLLYGLFREDPVIYVSNAIALVSVGMLTAVKVRSRLYRFEHVELVVPGWADPATALQSLREIGPQLAADLKAVGISDPAALRAAGAEDANRRLIEAGFQTGVHSRHAIEAALARLREESSGGGRPVKEEGKGKTRAPEARGAIEGRWGILTLRRHPRTGRRSDPGRTRLR